jgi:hypothetical protein
VGEGYEQHDGVESGRVDDGESQDDVLLSVSRTLPSLDVHFAFAAPPFYSYRVSRFFE